jgi:CheY-like chemotaxis protein
MVLHTAKVILEQAGYSVLVAIDGANGLRMLRAEPEQIDLILLDMGMPGKSGVEVLREIRLFNENIPVAIASGNSEEEVARRFRPNTISGFVQKPFTSSRLVDDIAGLLMSSHAARPR